MPTLGRPRSWTTVVSSLTAVDMTVLVPGGWLAPASSRAAWTAGEQNLWPLPSA